MEGAEDSTEHRSGAGSMVETRAPLRIDPTLEVLIQQRAQRATLTDVIALGPHQLPAARDRFVGVPVLLSPSGHLFVLRGHSHAAIAREVLTAVGLPFDRDHPDRTLGSELGWIMIQAAGLDGLRIQIDRAPRPGQRDVLEDLLLYEGFAGRPATIHWERPYVWSQAILSWEPNPRFVSTSDPVEARRLLRRADPR